MNEYLEKALKEESKKEKIEKEYIKKTKEDRKKAEKAMQLVSDARDIIGGISNKGYNLYIKDIKKDTINKLSEANKIIIKFIKNII